MLQNLELRRNYLLTVREETQDEIQEMMKKDPDALSILLGDKLFFFGEKPSDFDATAFAYLAMIFSYLQLNDEIIKYTELSTPNLKIFFDRTKFLTWPDWDHVCQTLEINSKTEEEK